MALWQENAVYCNICEYWLNGQLALEDHLRGRNHCKKKRRFDLARATLRSVVNKVLLELEEAGVFAQTSFALKIVKRSPVKWFTPVKTFLLECIASIIHSDRRTQGPRLQYSARFPRCVCLVDEQLTRKLCSFQGSATSKAWATPQAWATPLEAKDKQV